MTQVDLPQISLQRYVDLLKRRRWQLVPVSLLGLLVGGLVAFLIPRYYVSDTLLKHDSLPNSKSAPDDDPFRVIVDTAQLTIPLSVGDAMRQLKWPEALVADPSERTLHEKAVAGRINVWDQNRGDKGRRYAQFGVSYKDRDGARAADLLNTLVQVWLKKRLEELRGPTETARREANDAETRWSNTYDRYLSEKKQIEQSYGIMPDVDLAAQRERQRTDAAAEQKREELLLAKQGERAHLTVTIENQRAKLQTMPERVPLDAKQLAKVVAGDPVAVRLVTTIAGYQQAIENFSEGSPQRATYERSLKDTQAALRTALTTLDVDIDEAGTMRNLEREAVKTAIAEAEAKIAGLDAEIKVIEATTKAEQERLLRLSDGFELWLRKNDDLENAKKERDDARARARAAEDTLGQLQKDVPVQVISEAKVPPAPTDPNVLLVALVGCMLGLGLAIGLVLLIDLLQATFKTVDDVERGVPLPVLGGMSHLETEEERQSARRSRRRTSLVAVTLTALVALIVTIYYVDNTRLPGPVRDLLAMLLGN